MFVGQTCVLLFYVREADFIFHGRRNVRIDCEAQCAGGILTNVTLLDIVFAPDFLSLVVNYALKD